MSESAAIPNDISDDPRRVLRWYVDAGVDEAVGETPVNRYALKQDAEAKRAAQAEELLKQSHAEQDARPQTPARTERETRHAGARGPGQGYEQGGGAAPASKPAAKADPADEQIKTAVALAEGAKSLDDLRAALEGFDGCALKKTAMNLVFGDGNPDARVVFIGEAPGADEDRQGLPFVGPSGQLLDKMLASIGLDRSQVFISNTVYWRPPGNRTPHPGEVAACLPFAERMIELIDPALVVCVGGAAAHAMLAEPGSVSRMVGRWFTYETPRMSHPVDASVIYHPSYLLRSPAMKRQAWQSLLAIRAKLDELGV